MSRRVLVTGGSRGVGQAIAQRYREAGYEVVTPSREELDLEFEQSIHHYFEQRPEVVYDVLINNAAENVIAPIPEIPPETWHRLMKVNVTAPFLLTQIVSRGMRRQQWGRIVNMSSAYSMISRSGRAAYASTKSALNGLTRSAALEFAEFNILVNAVCPGFVETDMTRNNNTAQQLDVIRQQIPLHRLATPREVAEFVYYLGSEANSYITGQALVIDGGFLAQ